jgi:hypothetical protein
MGFGGKALAERVLFEKGPHTRDSRNHGRDRGHPRQDIIDPALPVLPRRGSPCHFSSYFIAYYVMAGKRSLLFGQLSVCPSTETAHSFLAHRHLRVSGLKTASASRR